MEPREPTGPDTPQSATRLLTRLERQQVYVLLSVFAIWFPLYLVWGRPIVEAWLFHYADSIPAEIHVIPALALPILAALVYGKVVVWRRRDHT